MGILFKNSIDDIDSYLSTLWEEDDVPLPGLIVVIFFPNIPDIVIFSPHISPVLFVKQVSVKIWNATLKILHNPLISTLWSFPYPQIKICSIMNPIWVIRVCWVVSITAIKSVIKKWTAVCFWAVKNKNAYMCYCRLERRTMKKLKHKFVNC